jgi:hypothetical protein
MNFYLALIIVAIITSIFNVCVLGLRGWRSNLLNLIWGILFVIIWNLIY